MLLLQIFAGLQLPGAVRAVHYPGAPGNCQRVSPYLGECRSLGLREAVSGWHLWSEGEGGVRLLIPWLREWLAVLCSLTWWLPLSGLHPLLYSRCWESSRLYARAYDGPRGEPLLLRIKTANTTPGVMGVFPLTGSTLEGHSDRQPTTSYVTWSGLQRLGWLGGGGWDEEKKNPDSSLGQQGRIDLGFQSLWKTWKKPLPSGILLRSIQV